MSGITIQDNATRALVSALKGLSTRQQVTSNNLANIDTPGFKASQVSFAEQLASAMGKEGGVKLATTQPGHLVPEAENAPAEITVLRNTSQRLDGNNVDIEKEMVSLIETTMHYQATARVVNSRLGMLRTVIRGGGR